MTRNTTRDQAETFASDRQRFAKRRAEMQAENEATRPAVRKQDGKVYQACRAGVGEIECLTCEQIIPASSPFRTCPACATTWREAFGPRWFEQPHHTKMVAQHEQLYNSYHQGVRSLVDKASLTTDNAITPVSVDFQGVQNAHHPMFVLVRNLRVNKGLGARKIRQKIERFNRLCVDAGKEPLRVPAMSTVSDWLVKIDAEYAPTARKARKKAA
jgi:hypothetical protein